MIKKLKNLPLPGAKFEYKDWKQTTFDYIDYVTNPSNTYHSAFNEIDGYIENTRTRKIGRFLPSANIDVYFKKSGNLAFGLPSYIGSKVEDDDIGEGINILGLVLSGSLVGIDMSNYKNFDFLKGIVHFFESSKERVILNGWKGGFSGKSFWYDLLPGVLFTGIVGANKNCPKYLEDILLENARNWYQVVVDLGGEKANFKYKGYSIINKVAIEDLKHPEEEAAAGIAYILYFAYTLCKKENFGDKNDLENFRNGAIWAMNYLNNLENTPLYEELVYFAPYVAARMNKEFDLKYDIKKLINFSLHGDSYSRPGWGLIDTIWGDVYSSGLLGSITDGDGYAFTMNTFDAALGFIPLLRYDQKYLNDIARWIYCASVSAQYFYPDKHKFSGNWVDSNGVKLFRGDCQSSIWIGENDTRGNFIAYEGLRRHRRIVSYDENKNRISNIEYFENNASASGDAYTFNWFGHTDYGLYGSSHVGIFGSIIHDTNCHGVIMVNVSKLDFFAEDTFEDYLLINYTDQDALVRVSKKYINLLNDENIPLIDGLFIRIKKEETLLIREREE